MKATLCGAKPLPAISAAAAAAARGIGSVVVAAATAMILLASVRAEAAPYVARKVRPQALLFIHRAPTPQEAEPGQVRAKYEPVTGCYLGGYIEFDRTLKRKILDEDHVQRRDPMQFEERVRKPHAMYFFYVGYGRRLPLGWIRWLAARGKFVHIALEPNDGLDRVRNDAYLQKLADDLAATRARVFLRFGSEMNGEWTNYHQPQEFRRKFRLVHDVMRARAPNVAMVWCPYATPVRNVPDYYPGDDATDWVGVNMYSVFYHNNKLAARCDEEHPNDLLATVYNHYAARKPMMICEYAATHYSDCDRLWRPDFASLKISTLYQALPRLYPRIKAINYFDLSISGVRNNYSVTDDPAVLDTYRRSVAPAYYLSGAAVAPDRPVPAPLPVRRGELLRGRVALSCFARGPSDRVTVRYTIDGKRVHSAARPMDWPFTLDAASLAPGRHVLALDVFDERGRRVAGQAVPVITAR